MTMLKSKTDAPILPEGWSLWEPADGSPIPVADDNGFAQHKIAFWITNGEETKPYCISRPSVGALGWDSAATLEGGMVGAYKVNGTKYTISDQVPNPIVNNRQEYATSDFNAVLIHHYLAQIGFGGKKVRLMTGLPYDHYYRDGLPNEEFLARVKASLAEAAIEPHPHMEAPQFAQIEEHLVTSESIAAIYNYLSDADDDVIESGIAVVDIGGNTTDITVSDNNYRLDGARCGTDYIGMNHVRASLVKLLQAQKDYECERRDLLDKIIRTKSAKIFGTPTDVSGQVTEAFSMTIAKLEAFVSEKLGNTGALDVVLFVGGGAETMRDHLAFIRNRHIPENADQQNALGMLKVASN